MDHPTHSVRRPVRLLFLIAALPLILFALLPMLSSGASTQSRLSDIQHQIQATQAKIGKRKGTERVLSSDIARWTAKINRLQGSVGQVNIAEIGPYPTTAARQIAAMTVQNLAQVIGIDRTKERGGGSHLGGERPC